MDLDLSSFLATAATVYTSKSQIARNVTESWASRNLYCPRCGLPLHPYRNNTRVNDFYCDHSQRDFVLLPVRTVDNFQLKSMQSFPHNHFPPVITGAAYQTTISSLEQGTFPSLILLHYNLDRRRVEDGLFIHRLSVTLKSIGKRTPLTVKARRANWIGANILLHKIPRIGWITMIQDTVIVPKNTIMKKWSSVERVLKGNLESRGWISEIMLLVDRLPDEFSLDDVYSHETYLAGQFPNNRHVRDKIRQQLQVLRERGYLKFVSRGRYQKVGQ